MNQDRLRFSAFATPVQALSRAALLFLAASCLLFQGCSSAKPPPPAPPAVVRANQASTRAIQTSQNEIWPNAVQAWQTAAERYRLLNNLPGLAMALHNLGQAELELERWGQAKTHLEEAAALHDQLRNTTEWWRDQVALLQIEAGSREQEALRSRLDRLQPRAAEPTDARVRGLFLNEMALWERSQKRPEAAAELFAQAEQQFQSAQDRLGLAIILANRALLQEETGDLEAAITSWQAALAAFEKLGDPGGITLALAGTGRTLLKKGENLPQAEALLRRAADNYRTLGKSEALESTLATLRECVQKQGRPAAGGP